MLTSYHNSASDGVIGVSLRTAMRTSSLRTKSSARFLPLH